MGSRYLLGSAGFEVAGETGKAAEAVRVAKELCPDFADLRLGEDSSIVACRAIKTSVHVPFVLVFNAHTSGEDITGITLAGTDGYLHTGAAGEELLDAVRRTHVGGQRLTLAESKEGAVARIKDTSYEARLTPKEISPSSSSAARIPRSPGNCT